MENVPKLGPSKIVLKLVEIVPMIFAKIYWKVRSVKSWKIKENAPKDGLLKSVPKHATYVIKVKSQRLLQKNRIE